MAGKASSIVRAVVRFDPNERGNGQDIEVVIKDVICAASTINVARNIRIRQNDLRKVCYLHIMA